MIFNDLDVGGSHGFPAPQIGQTIGTALIEGSRTIVWPRGQLAEKQDVRFWVSAWQAVGGQAAGSFQALRYLIRQLEELATNPNLQPVYIQWTATAATGGYNVADTHDGWYVIHDLQPDYQKFIVSGLLTAKLTVSQVAPSLPSPLALWWSGAALSSNYSAPASNFVGFPIGSVIPPTLQNRTAAEGAIPCAGSVTLNPLYFAPPSTIASLFTGQVRVYDNLVAGSTPPTNGTYISSNWVEVKGTTHVFAGDVVVTNGLLLLRFQVGTANSPEVWVWNSVTSAWTQIGAIQYQENGGATGNLRSISLDLVGLEEVRVNLVCSTASGGNFCRFRMKLQRGFYGVPVEVWPQTQAHTSKTNLVWSLASAYATGFTDTSSSTTFPTDLAVTTTSGYSAGQGSANNSPLFGFFYQNQPTTDQGYMSSSTLLGLGDTAGPAAGSFILYGFFAMPYSGTPSVATARSQIAPEFQRFLYNRTVRWARG